MENTRKAFADLVLKNAIKKSGLQPKPKPTPNFLRLITKPNRMNEDAMLLRRAKKRSNQEPPGSNGYHTTERISIFNQKSHIFLIYLNSSLLINAAIIKYNTNKYILLNF